MSSKPTTSSKPLCLFYRTRGGCKKGDACLYSHESPTQSSEPSTPSSPVNFREYTTHDDVVDEDEAAEDEGAEVARRMVIDGYTEEQFIKIMENGDWRQYLYDPNFILYYDDGLDWFPQLVAPVVPVAPVASGQTEKNHVSAAVVPAPHASFSRPEQATQQCNFGNMCHNITNGKCTRKGHDQAPPCRYGSSCRNQGKSCDRSGHDREPVGHTPSRRGD